MTAKIISTIITGNTAKVIIANNVDRDLAATWLEFSVSLDRMAEQSLQTIQTEALRSLRNEVGAQIQALARTGDQGS